MSLDAGAASTPRIPGIHHVTAISGPAQANLDFYTGVLGLRMVKRTVNFDDPGTYHLYYGDRVGTPGTIMTFFPWERAEPGRRGSRFTDATSFAVPAESGDFWAGHLERTGVAGVEREVRFGADLVRLKDPDGLVLELVAGADTRETPAGLPVHPDIPPEHAIRSFHGVLLDVADPDASARLLTDLLGYEHIGEEGGRLRFRAGEDEVGAVIDLLTAGSSEDGRMGKGSVHHVAFRARDDEEQRTWREALVTAGIPVTTVQDRNYFRSIYFHEPGGVLFEIATDGPGFTADETEEDLGRDVKLPVWLEGRRAELESQRPPLTMPHRNAG